MMLYLKPRLLGSVGLDDAVLKADKKDFIGPTKAAISLIYMIK